MNASWINSVLGIGVFSVYALTSCYGLYLLKAAPAVKSWLFLSGLVLYIIGAGMWMFILRLYPLSVAFPIASGALVIGTTLTGMVFLNENVNLVHLFGAGLILAGIALISIGK